MPTHELQPGIYNNIPNPDGSRVEVAVGVALCSCATISEHLLSTFLEAREWHDIHLAYIANYAQKDGVLTPPLQRVIDPSAPPAPQS